MCGVWYALAFPDSLLKAKFLTEDEKIIAIERIRANNTGVENKHFKWDQAVEALLDCSSTPSSSNLLSC